VSVALAVDGGNSKTHAALVTSDGEVLGAVRGPQSSPDHLGVDGSLDVVAGLARELGGDPDLAVLLLAGVDFPDEEESYRRAAEPRGLARRLIVGNDTFAVLRAGSTTGWGVAVTCGAGINCVGLAPDGSQVRFPSLGEVSGDWGGGRDVGFAAVYAAARSHDGRGPQTILEQVVPAHFGLATPVELARALFVGRVAAEEVRTLAPVTFALAREDAVAASIVDRLADEVVTMARAALQRLELQDDAVEVVLGGGLLQSGDERLIGGIERGIAAIGPRLRVVVAAWPPIVGAALVALDELGASAEAQERVRAELGDAVAALVAG
jgi:N-acetylglucosamine kinase-like BadF-type ATPase